MLFDHINRFTPISKSEFEQIEPFFEKRSVAKKEILYRAGDHALKHYFVSSGCVHLYFINERGSEQTLQFAIENWWITDYLAFQNNGRSDFFIQAVEPSELLQISFQKQEEMLRKFPQMETYFRNIYQKAYGAAIMRMKYIFSYSKEEIYFRFRDAFPEFVNNVPQYLVATYLGLSPEYVSKLRRKSIS
ncbi:Crp/Fnr family transcriptional regulator [Echinicola sediminis]